MYTDEVVTQTSTTGSMGSLLFAWFFYLVFLALVIVGMWKVFVKAGKPGWASLIPIYNTIVLIEIAGKPIWWFLLFFVPIVNIVIAIMLINEISKKFGKGVGFTLGLIFLPFIFWLMLGFGSAQYQGTKEPAAETPTPIA